MNNEIRVDGRAIGSGNPVFIVAEMSANHNQDVERAEAILRAAKDVGADAIKLQTYTPDTMTLDCDADWFRVKGTVWEGSRLYDLYKEAMTPWEWYPRLGNVARDLGLTIFSTPFDASAVEFLQSMDAPVYKVASFELVDLPLLRAIARTGKPVIMSTGMATRDEISEAVDCLRVSGAAGLALLHCVSAYPAPPDRMRLRNIPLLEELFQCPAGLSDHSLGFVTAVAATALGARIIEKHFTLDHSAPGPDSGFSMAPEEFRQMVDAVRTVEKSLGQPSFAPDAAEAPTRALRRSLFAVKDVKAGDNLTTSNIASLRPGLGLASRYQDDVLQRRAKVDIPRGTPLSWDLLDGPRPEKEDDR